VGEGRGEGWMLSSRSDNARLQSDFYRDQYRKMLRWLMGSVVIIIIMVLMIIYQILFRAPQQYYANTIEGRILPMPPGVEKKHGT
jgi:hypothetical protein